MLLFCNNLPNYFDNSKQLSEFNIHKIRSDDMKIETAHVRCAVNQQNVKKAIKNTIENDRGYSDPREYLNTEFKILSAIENKIYTNLKNQSLDEIITNLTSNDENSGVENRNFEITSVQLHSSAVRIALQNLNWKQKNLIF